MLLTLTATTEMIVSNSGLRVVDNHILHKEYCLDKVSHIIFIDHREFPIPAASENLVCSRGKY